MKKSWKRLISALLSVVMVIAIALPAVAYDFGEDAGVEKSLDWEKVSDELFAAALKRKGVTLPESEPLFADEDVVRVSIVLSAPSTIEMGFATEKIAENAEAMQYRKNLASEQDRVAAAISKKALGGAELDVVWNLTLAANIISAYVPYGKIDSIKSVAGVKDVVLEMQYEPEKTETSADPEMSVASGMVGASYAWAAGYTGAGSKIAVIDTGLDTDHQSFSSEAFDYAIAEIEAASGKEVDLLTLEDVAALLDKLHVSERYEGLTAEDLYVGSKVPFAFNYVDKDLDVTHDNDKQEEHGSHVSGIAAANRYIKTEEGYADALDLVKTQGEAPDAQIIVMKVFGKGGGAYDSDYMTAIEDAIVLGCDSANLSLGSAAMGFARAGIYEEIMNKLTESSTVVTMSGGNAYHWANFTQLGYLYSDDVSFSRNGSPSSYINSFAVASVDNDGTTGPYLSVADEKIFYAETTSYGNAPIATIGGQEYDYIYIDSVGEDYEFAAVADVLEGKIAICNRGDISFYVKANNAVANGAVATIIANNQDGVINMNLTGYLYNAPAVSITLADGEFIKENSDFVEGEEISYYTGKIYVGNTVDSVVYDSFFYTMSDFSSWGITGNLDLKPEITAPGGNIYSVNGLPKETDQYESMSGTSMAAPQIAGLSAVLAQYLRETGLLEKTGLTTRQLTNSLLMSTAEPLIDGGSNNYYPVIQQGAGLARIDSAIAAKTYILMDESATVTAKDGKVKAELGENDGQFSVKFTVNNFTDKKIDTVIDAAFFTQDIFTYYVIDGSGYAVVDEDGYPVAADYLDTWTYPLYYDIVWKIDGEEMIFGDVNTEYIEKYDVNGDHCFDKFDAIDLLGFITGELDELDSVELADVNADGMINTLDVYVLLKALCEVTATVPANGSIEVEADVTLDTEFFDKYLSVVGNYIEGYIYVAEDLLDEVGVTHTIPVVGFYGNWSDASMFDKGSLLEYLYGDEYRTPYMTYVYGDEAMTIQSFYAYSKLYDQMFEYGGNPLVYDEVYLPERNAVSNDYTVNLLQYTQIRNGAAKRLRVYADGEPVYEEISGTSYAAYYHVNEGAWRNTVSQESINFAYDGLADGTVLTFELTIAPEYYVDGEGNVDWDALGKGATMSISAVVDNTAPEIEDLSLGYVKEKRAFGLSIKANDNQYIAGVDVAAFTPDGLEPIDFAGADLDAAAGDTYETFIPLDLYSTDENGNIILEYPYIYVVVYDYAANIAVYKINLNTSELADPDLDFIIDDEIMIIGKGEAQITYIPLPWGIEDEEGYTVTFESSDESVITVDENGLIKSVADDNATATVTVTATLGEASCSVECTVNVAFLDVVLNGVVWDENGEVWFSEFDIMRLPEYTKLTDERSSMPIGATAIDANGTLFAATQDDDEYSDLFIVNDDFSLEPIGTSSVCFFDLAAAPALGEGMFVAVYGPYVLIVDMSVGDYIGVFDMSDYTAGADIVGITYEESYESPYGTADFFMFVDRNGNLFEVGFLPYNGSVANFKPYLMGNLGYKTDSYKYNALYFDGMNVYWSKFDSAKNNVELIMIYDLYNVGAIVNLGAFDDGVWPVAGIYEDGFSLPMYYYGEFGDDDTTDRHAGIELQGMAADSIESASFGASLRDETASEAESAVTKDLVSDKTINNGLIVIDYDPQTAVVEVLPALGYTSINEIEEGHILVAFADADEIAAGTVLATVKADLAEGAEGSVIYVAYKDGAATVEFETIVLGEATPEEQVSTVVTGVTFNWSEDHTEATATVEIEGGEPLTLDAEVVIKNTATCLLDGYAYYTALLRFNDTIYTETYLEEVEASGHDYAEPEWAWKEDLSEAYLWIMCKNMCLEDDGNVVFTATVEVEEFEPTCEEDGYTLYTATVDINDYLDACVLMAQYYLEVYGSIEAYNYYMELYAFYQGFIDLFGQSLYVDTVVVPGEPAHHVYELSGWEWTEDLSAATVKFVCGSCGDEQTVEATVTSEFVNGSYVYTATAEFEGETYTDTVTVTVAGDADGDGQLTGKDLIRLRKFLISYDPDLEVQEVEIFPGADVNGDGKIDGRDLIALRKLLIEA